MSSHKAVQVKSAGAPLELADVETTSPGRGEVRISVKACGICGTDAHFVAGDFPGLSWPLTLGHEIAGTRSACAVDGWSDCAHAAPRCCTAVVLRVRERNTSSSVTSRRWTSTATNTSASIGASSRRWVHP